MPAPRTVPDLDPIPHLPLAHQLLAEFYLTHPRSSPDYLFLLAEACDQAAADPRYDPRPAAAVRELARELRRRAPSYASYADKESA